MIKYLLAGAAALATAATASAATYAIQAGHLIVDAAQPARGARDGQAQVAGEIGPRRCLHR